MHTQDSNTRTPGALNHPGPDEWMDFLYGELPPERKRDLARHLDLCPTCAARAGSWRTARGELDQWRLPAIRTGRRQPSSVWKWAAAAGIMLAVGFGLGWSATRDVREVAELRAMVLELSATLNQRSDSGPAQALATPAGAPDEEIARLLGDYNRLHEERRVADQQALNAALQTLDNRLNRMRAELETVAVNTQDGFHQARQHFAHLASFAGPAGSAVPTSSPEAK